MPEPLSSEFDERRELERLQAALAARLVYPDRPIGGLGLEAIELDRAAETLVRKRISQTRGLLPRSVELLGKEYRKSFREFARSHHFDGHRAILIDAERFAGWMLARARDKSKTEPMDLELQEALRWEQEMCRARLSRFRVRWICVGRKVRLVIRMGKYLRVWGQGV